MNAPQLSHVLTPVDLGHSSEAALRCAQKLAGAFGARLTLMYVNDGLTLQSYDEIYTGYRDLPDEQKTMMADAVREWARPIIGNAKYDVLAVADDPVRAIASAAERVDADLIVMGTHRRTGWQRLMGGSLSEAVLHHTDRPVIAVPQSSGLELSDIVCPVNFTDVAHRAARAACCMSSAIGARLHVLHVAERPAHELAKRLREWVGSRLSPDCNVHEIIARGSSADERIVEYAGEVRAGFIVVGAERRRNGERATIGTTTERIMRLSPTPVMSVVRPMRVVDSILPAA
jgi:nucleotide-binding universal stress UspA family protein